MFGDHNKPRDEEVTEERPTAEEVNNLPDSEEDAPSDELADLINRLEQDPADREDAQVDPLPVSTVRPFAIKVSQVKALIQKNPTHPKSTIFKKAIRRLPDSHQLFIEREDLEAVLKGLETYQVERTEIDKTTNTPVRVRRKLTRQPSKDSSPKKVEVDPNEREVVKPLPPTQ